MFTFPIHLCKTIQRATTWIGGVSAVAIFLAMCLQMITVVARYGFSIGSVGLQESALYCHSLAFMLAIGFGLQKSAHVRVDIFYRAMSWKTQRLINTFGFLLCLLPMCIVLIWVSWPFVNMAWTIKEGSPESGGLPFLYLNKTLLIIMPICVLLEGIASLVLEWLNVRD